ncbi:MAG: Fe(2+) transporter permease subunit FeoB [Gammaproteobacteria bacterium]|nr:Fe(2+) transporter permease subunit FeoB [Gammaproteobacteria bacterium]
MSDFTIGVAGNPNCGKTTLFNALTGAKQEVGNWPGVTVERKVGHYQHEGHEIEVVDLPGTYSLDVLPGTASADEQIAQEYILSNEADLIVNIVDASNLERNLYLSTQLLDMQTPMLIALNMMDVARQNNIKIDLAALSAQLGTSVIALSAAKEEGIEELKAGINLAAAEKHIPAARMQYPQLIEDAVAELSPLASKALPEAKKTHARWVALQLLENAEAAECLGCEEAMGLAIRSQRDIEAALDEEIDILIADHRYGFIGKIVEKTVKKTDKISQSASAKIDKVVLHRVLGIPIFFGAMYLMFMFTINLGGAFIDFFDLLVGAFLVDGLAEALGSVGAPVWLTVLLANGFGGGIQVIATFIPIIGFLYVFLSFLEDSGYMARAAFVMDRFMYSMGLPGKSFVPMIVGFGCNVPAVMATRTLENQRDRTLTILMNPFMSCGARLPVYVLFAAAFFPVGGQNLVFGLYLLGIAVAVLTGFIMKSTLLQGEPSPFVMELPAYHLPTLKGVLLRAWERLKGFIFRAGQVIVPMVVVLSFLNSWGMDGSFGNEDSERSVLSEVGRSITPAFEPMGIHQENWPATVGIFTGVLAKEAVVGTLDSIYGQLAEADAGTEEEKTFSLWAGVSEAFASVPVNLVKTADTVLDPLGLDIGDISDKEAAAQAQEVSSGTYAAMAQRFDGKAGAFAYLLFILLYSPCLAAIAAIYRETNSRWTAFVVAWTTGLAYLFATVFYQLATYPAHPHASLLWTAGLLSLFALTVLTLRTWGRKGNRQFPNVRPALEES